MKCSTDLTIFVLTSLFKLGFGVFFIVGSVFRHPNENREAWNICNDIHAGVFHYESPESWEIIQRCSDDFRNGFFITGAILFFISILLEAFGINKEFTFRNIAATMIHALGSLFLLIASLYQLLVLHNSSRPEAYYYYSSNSDYVEAGFWIAGGIITAMGQVYLAFLLREEGRFLICTYLIAFLGSIFFMVAGIIMSKDVAENYMYWVLGDINPPTIAVLLIIGSVFYTVHAILYPFALYKKVFNLTSLQIVKIGLVLLVLTKLGFGLLFTSGWVYHHTNQYDEAIKFCNDIGKGGELSVFDCWVHFKGGLLISGAILLFFSIVLEAFQVNNIFTNGTIAVTTIIRIIGSIVYIAASMYQVLITDGYYFLFPDNNFDDIESGLWIFGSLMTCLGQAYLTWQTRGSEGSLLLTLTYSFAIFGSFLLMIGGILMLEAVVGKVDTNDFRGMKEYVNTVVGCMISGSVFYIIHAILYPLATYEKLIASTSIGVHLAAVSSNPNEVDLHDESNEIQNDYKDEEEQQLS